MTPRRRKKQGARPSNDLWSALYPTLDLHGLTASEASTSARAWLRQNHLDGEPTVRLITGRGLHSQGPPVLPAEIEALLHDLRNELVLDWEREAGGGVYRVRLKKPPLPPLLRAEPPPPTDPALLRAAEDALADLGIAPTPALLQAEIRRILAERPEKRE